MQLKIQTIPLMKAGLPGVSVENYVTCFLMNRANGAWGLVLGICYTDE
jgi:hypothetical protein